MAKKYIYFFIGTTAEFIKLAPVIKELKKRKVYYQIITSGQNSIHVDDFKNYVANITINHAFTEKAHQSSIPLFFVWTVSTFFHGLIYFYRLSKKIDKKNSYFVVHGDTISSLIGAMIFKVLGLQLVHIEAGLRSFNFWEPFPEEICRYIINYFSSINFCQNEWSMNNIKGLPSQNVNTKQNTLIEICLWALHKKKGLDYAKKFNKYYILIIHRQEHVYFNKEKTTETMKSVIDNADKNLNCLFIMHALTSRFLKSENLEFDKNLYKRLLLIPKLPYIEFMTLLNNAEFIATDGCTNQEEVYYMGLPCLALRNVTERTEGLGENIILSKNSTTITKSFLKNYKKFRRKPIHIKERPSKIIVDYLLK